MSHDPGRTPAGLHRLPLEVELNGRPLRLEPAAIETDRGLLLVDTGLPGTLDDLAARLADVGFGLSEVATVLLTHQDGDHAGNLAALGDSVATPPFVVAHEAAARVVDGHESPRGSDAEDDRYPPARVDLELAGEASISTSLGPARVIPTPGHTPGHVSVYLPDEKFLIAADALTADDGRLEGPRPDVSEDMATAYSSVERLADLDVARTLCYHGGFVDAGRDRIAAIAADGPA